MSWQATTAVISDSRHKGSELLCMLMLANYANPTGGSIFPKVDQLAKDCRMSARAVRYILGKLKASGELIDEGEGWNNTRRYSLALQSLQCKPASPSPANQRQNRGPSPAIAVAPKQSSGEQSEENSQGDVSLIEEELELDEDVLPAIPFATVLRKTLDALTGEAATNVVVAWCKFAEDRKARKKPLTHRASEAIGNKLAQHPDRAEAALLACIERSWMSFEWEWLERKTFAPQNGSIPTPPKARTMLSASEQRERRGR